MAKIHYLILTRNTITIILKPKERNTFTLKRSLSVFQRNEPEIYVNQNKYFGKMFIVKTLEKIVRGYQLV